MEPKLSIVVPCYNEQGNVPVIIERFHQLLESEENPGAEVILVDNGSTDNTTKELQEGIAQQSSAGLRTVRVEKNQGYGFGILSGLETAQGEVLAWTHADMQTDPADVFKAYRLFEEKQKAGTPIEKFLVKGLRVGRKWSDWGFTFGMAMICTLVLGRVLYDINAQPKVFHRDFFKKLKNPPFDFSLDLFLLYQMKQQGGVVATFPVHFGERLHGESKWAFSFSSKIKTIKRTIDYIFRLRKQLRGHS